MKKVLVGCGIAALCALVLVIILAFTYGPRMARWGGDMIHKANDEIRREQARTQALSAWAPPPPDTPAEGLFPARVGAATRTVLQDGAVLSALGISRPARQATYTLAGAEIEVWAFPVNDLEKDGLLAQIRAAHDRSGGTKTSVTLPSRSSFSSSTIGINHVLTPTGWLFVFRPRSEADPFGFMDDFFRGGGGGT
jgi:hypothetical protein